MKKQSLLSFLFFIAFAFTSLNAQTVDEIIAKYHANIGGVEKLKALKSTIAKGNVKVQGMDLPMSIYNAAPNKQKMVLNIQGQEFVQTCYDGTTGWTTNFATMKPEKMEAEDSDNMKNEGEVEDAFIDYAKKGYKVELQGKETVEGVACFKVKLTKKPIKVDGKEEENSVIYFFDAENYVPIVMRMTAKKGQMKGLTIDSIFSDYQEVNGLYFPFTMSQKVNGQVAANIAIEKMEINVPVEDSVFAFPK